MKRVLITGSNSYVGNKLTEWLEKFPNEYSIDSVSVRDNSWKKRDFSNYDVVFHTAGIAHIKETKENKNLYYKVNRDLAFEVAQKAKVESVKHFIFVSTMSVYGIDNGVIDIDTPLKPKTNYGKSKLQAEELIATIEDENFKVSILRPPMIYGKGCKGNYARLAKLAVKMPIFPDVDNKRSMVFIDNLTEFVKKVIDEEINGILCPQNDEYVKTSRMVKLIANSHGKTILLTKLFNPLLVLMRNTGTFKKVFGDLVYKESLSEYNSCQLKRSIDIEESIRLTEE